MQDNYTTKHPLKGKHLTFKERELIEAWKKLPKPKSNREIARLLGKSPQTIHNEISRGLVDLTFSGGNLEYSAQKAQSLYDHHRLAVGKTDIWSPEKEEKIKNGILNRLSPEVISLDPEMPSVGTIYNWIYKGWIRGISRKEMIYPRKPKVAKVDRQKPPRKPHALSIDLRPDVINRREEPGHFEIDLIILNHHKGEQLLTLTDRMTRYPIIVKIPDKTSKSVNDALTVIQKTFHLRSITSDNGSEFLNLDLVVQCPVYYAHPYASYERGSNENMNRMIRRWIPKGTHEVSDERVTFVEDWIKNYPRKMFGFKSSAQHEATKELFISAQSSDGISA